MSSSGQTFSDTEKVCRTLRLTETTRLIARGKNVLLAEIIKFGKVPPGALIDVIRRYSVSPEWADISRPAGRSLQDCQNVYQALLAAPYGEAPIDAPRSPHSQAQYITSAGGQQGSSKSRQGSYATILPRPSDVPWSTHSPGGRYEPLKRKRGRPSNAENERRKQEALARGQPWPPPGKKKKKKPASNESQSAQPKDDEPAAPDERRSPSRPRSRMSSSSRPLEAPQLPPPLRPPSSASSTTLHPPSSSSSMHPHMHGGQHQYTAYHPGPQYTSAPLMNAWGAPSGHLPPPHLGSASLHHAAGGQPAGHPGSHSGVHQQQQQTQHRHPQHLQHLHHHQPSHLPPHLMPPPPPSAARPSSSEDPMER